MQKQPGATSVKKNALIATVAIFGSRLFGLIREQVFAIFFGASFALDAFIAAFRIPNLLRDLFAEGALSQSFVTIFSQKLALNDEAKAYQLANRVTTFLILFLGFIVTIGMVFSPTIVSFIANGFTGEKFDLTVSLNRILFPFILFVALAALLMGMLNAKGKFFLPQSASTFFNITSIGVGLLTAWFLSPQYVTGIFARFTGGTATPATPEDLKRAISGMAIGTLVGGVVQWAIQIPALHRLGYRQKLDANFRDPDFRRVLLLTIPSIIGSAGVQVNVMTDTFFASYLPDGAISYLNYAFRFMQFPLGLFGVAIASASAPVLAGMITRGERDAFCKTLRGSLQMSTFFNLPSLVGLIILSGPIVSLIYEHGRFDHADMLETSYALRAFSVGIMGYSLIKIYQPAYLAFHDTRTPMIISLLSIISNAGLDYFFMVKCGFRHWGLALSTSLVATLNFVFLAALFARHKMQGIWTKSLVTTLAKILLATFGMALAAYSSLSWVANWHITGMAAKLTQVFVPMICAAFIYGWICWILNVDEARLILKKITRR